MSYTFQIDDYRTAQWNSPGPCFHLEIDADFYCSIDHEIQAHVYDYAHIVAGEEGFSKIVLLEKVFFETLKRNWAMLETPLGNQPDLGDHQT